ncbi:MAG: response regulator [Fusicatenibacter sp.]|nr:response regulator [Lachnospiraceae bacterium]MDY2937965.1 response regulator [Fusicatenibacter sp.]
MGIRILIVDDDKLLVKKLEETVNWEKLGITMVFTANNIRQAQSILGEYPVDILLCDIDMPQGNGLELLEWIRNRKLDVECIFLSSYANFAYAQMALKLSSRDYLLKPISNAELEAAIGKVVKTIRERKQIPEALGDRKKEKFWENLLVQDVGMEQMISRSVSNKLYRKEDPICLILIRMLEIPAKENYKKEIALYDFVIRNIVSEFFLEQPEQVEALVHQSDLEWMLVLRETDDASPLRSAADLKTCLYGALKRRCCIYVGETEPFFRIKGSVERMASMEKYAVPDEEEILLDKDWSLIEKAYRKAPWDAWIREMEQSESVIPVKESILQFIDDCKADGGLRTDFLGHFIYELIQMLFRYLNDQGLSFGDFFDSGEFDAYEKDAHTSVWGSKELIRYLFEKLEGNKQTDSRRENVIEQLEGYIEQHLGEDLSRSVLAKKVYLSEDYISKLFVKETGMSIPNYIAARRMERAKEYLRNSGLPISKIALEVGYNNFSYFSKTFRDMTGYTPNEYRSKMRGSN